MVRRRCCVVTGCGDGTVGGSATIPVEDFTQEDRERVLELLLSQERVVTLLYARAFPMHTTTPSNNAAGAKAGGLLGVVEDETAVRPGSTGGGGGLTGGGLNNSSSEKLLPLINNGSNNPRPRTGGN